MLSVSEIATEFDLNALRVLVALERARNVSRAADSLGMSQSGFSTSLARLRRKLGDELFVRVPGGMEPTARAHEIVEAASGLLSRLESCINGPQAFQPATAEVGFQLCMADVAELVFMPGLIGHLKKHAPGISIHSQSIGAESLRDRLASGKADLAVGYYPDLETAGFFQQRFYAHTFACMVRKGHPALRGGVSKAAYQELGHAVVANPARSNQALEQALERQGIRRRVVLSTSHHLSLATSIAASDLVATVPLATAHHFKQIGLVEIAPLPIRPPVFSVSQYWHKRAHQDPKHVWLREQLALLFNPSTDAWQQTEQDLYGHIRLRGM